MATQSGTSTGLLSRLRNYFFAGILVAAPIGVTVAVAIWIVNFVDRVVVPLLQKLLGFPISFPGIGLIVVFLTLTAIGALTAGLVGRWVVRFGESIVERMPVMSTIYSAVKQILETVFRDQSQAFKHAVLVEYPRRGIWAMAFVTANTEGELQRILGKEHFNVFLPTTPNPTSGFLLVVPRDEVIVLDMTIEEAVKLIISAGILSPQQNLSGAERLLAKRMSRSEMEARLYGPRTENKDE